MSERAPGALPPVRELLPHAGRMLLLQCVLQHDVASTCCRVDLGAQSWLRRRDGSFPAWLCLELMAQCIAAHEGCRAWAERRPPGRGLLVGSRSTRFHRTRLGSREVLRVRARPVRGRPGLGVLAYACQVHTERCEADGSLVADGELNVVVADRAGWVA